MEPLKLKGNIKRKLKKFLTKRKDSRTDQKRNYMLISKNLHALLQELIICCPVKLWKHLFILIKYENKNKKKKPLLDVL